MDEKSFNLTNIISYLLYFVPAAIIISLHPLILFYVFFNFLLMTLQKNFDYFFLIFLIISFLVYLLQIFISGRKFNSLVFKNKNAKNFKTLPSAIESLYIELYYFTVSMIFTTFVLIFFVNDLPLFKNYFLSKNQNFIDFLIFFDNLLKEFLNGKVIKITLTFLIMFLMISFLLFNFVFKNPKYKNLSEQTKNEIIGLVSILIFFILFDSSKMLLVNILIILLSSIFIIFIIEKLNFKKIEDKLMFSLLLIVLIFSFKFIYKAWSGLPEEKEMLISKIDNFVSKLIYYSPGYLIFKLLFSRKILKELFVEKNNFENLR